MVQHINHNEFKKIISSENTILADFYSETCGPCMRMSPVLDQLSEDLGEAVKIVKINVAEETDLAVQHGVQSVPTFVLYKNGKEAAKTVGALPKSQLRDFIENN